MTHPPEARTPRWMLALLAVSILTNLLFAYRIYLPRWVQRWHEAMAVLPPVQAGEHLRGPADARVTLVEYSDFQCPYCATLHQELREGAAGVRWVYRHDTLNAGHPEANAAAEAAECAGEQGRFWDYADALFANQKELGSALYPRLAEKLGLDAPRFGACLSSGKYRALIRQESAGVADLHLVGTPTWFVNGKRYMGARDAKTLAGILQAAAAP